MNISLLSNTLRPVLGQTGTTGAHGEKRRLRVAESTAPGVKRKQSPRLTRVGLSTSPVNSLNPLHNLMSRAIIIPTLQRRKLRFHNCYRVALTLHGTRLWVKAYYEFLFHLDNGLKKIFF